MNFDERFGQFAGQSSKEKMINYIRQNYESLLGADVRLLDEEGGLEKIRHKYFQK